MAPSVNLCHRHLGLPVLQSQSAEIAQVPDNKAFRIETSGSVKSHQ